MKTVSPTPINRSHKGSVGEEILHSSPLGVRYGGEHQGGDPFVVRNLHFAPTVDQGDEAVITSSTFFFSTTSSSTIVHRESSLLVGLCSVSSTREKEVRELDTSTVSCHVKARSTILILSFHLGSSVYELPRSLQPASSRGHVERSETRVVGEVDISSMNYQGGHQKLMPMIGCNVKR